MFFIKNIKNRRTMFRKFLNLNPTHLYECAAPSLFFGLLLGITPIIPINQGINHQLITNKSLYLITFVYLIMYTMMLLLGQNDVEKFSKRHNISGSVSNTTTTISLFAAIITTYTIYISSFSNAGRIKDVLRSLAEVDVLLKQLGQEIQYKKDMWYQIITLFSLQFLQIIVLSIQIWNAPREHLPVPTFKAGFMVFFPAIAQNLIESQFVALTMAVYQRFRMVNQQIQRLDFHIKKNNIPVVLRRLDILMRVHDSLCDVSSLIDEAYGGQMFASSLAQFELIVTTMFTFYMNYSNTPVDSWILFIWGILKTVELLRKVIACHVTANQLMEFSQQLMHRKVGFTAHGMFSLDATLIFTVVATVTTYMVILYQFNEASQPPTCVIRRSTNFSHNTTQLT